MKFQNIAACTLLATTASAGLSGLFGSLKPYDESLDVPGENPLAHCEDPKDDILTLDSVDLDPNPPVPGETLTVTAKGTLSQDIEDGATVNLQVKYGLITIIRQTADLCETVTNVDLECPVKKGETNLTKEVDLPKMVPPGKYSVKADVFTKDEEKITCLEATVEFKRNNGFLEVLYHQDI